jgi:hypothetical protein
MRFIRDNVGRVERRVVSPELNDDWGGVSASIWGRIAESPTCMVFWSGGTNGRRPG